MIMDTRTLTRLLNTCLEAQCVLFGQLRTMQTMNWSKIGKMVALRVVMAVAFKIVPNSVRILIEPLVLVTLLCPMLPLRVITPLSGIGFSIRVHPTPLVLKLMSLPHLMILAELELELE